MLLFNNIENAVVWLYWFLNWSLLLLFYTFDSLPWQTLDDRRRYAKSVLMYKILNDHIALVPRNSFVRRNVNQTNYHLCDTATDLTLSKPKREFLKTICSQFALSLFSWLIALYNSWKKTPLLQNRWDKYYCLIPFIFEMQTSTLLYEPSVSCI